MSAWGKRSRAREPLPHGRASPTTLQRAPSDVTGGDFRFRSRRLPAPASGAAEGGAGVPGSAGRVPPAGGGGGCEAPGGAACGDGRPARLFSPSVRPSVRRDSRPRLRTRAEAGTGLATGSTSCTGGRDAPGLGERSGGGRVCLLTCFPFLRAEGTGERERAPRRPGTCDAAGGSRVAGPSALSTGPPPGRMQHLWKPRAGRKKERKPVPETSPRPCGPPSCVP